MIENEIPEFIQLTPNGHGFAKAEFSDGIDVFGYEEGYHNGPRCVFCHKGFCEHCYEHLDVISYEIENCSKAPLVVFEKPKPKEID